MVLEKRLNYHLRVAPSAGGPSLDLGPALATCWMRWTSPTRLWVFDPLARLWREYDIDRREPTGVTEGATEMAADDHLMVGRCPAWPHDAEPDAPRFIRDTRLNTWFVPAEARMWTVLGE
jgi:hypothetical protein